MSDIKKMSISTIIPLINNFNASFTGNFVANLDHGYIWCDFGLLHSFYS